MRLEYERGLLLITGDGVALLILSHSLTGGEGGVAFVSLLQSLTGVGGVALANLSHSLIGDQGKELVGERNEGVIGEGVRGDNFCEAATGDTEAGERLLIQWTECQCLFIEWTECQCLFIEHYRQSFNRIVNCTR